MNKVELKKFAAIGVRARLAELQQEIIELAKEFPDIVQNADGSLPAVAPITFRKSRPTTSAPPRLGPQVHRQRIWAYLKKHPNSTSAEIAAGVGLGKSYTAKLTETVARHTSGGSSSKDPFRWVARMPNPTSPATKTARTSSPKPKRRKTSARAKSARLTKTHTPTARTNSHNGHQPVMVSGVPSLATVKSPVEAAVAVLKKSPSPLSVKDLFANLKAHDFPGKRTNETSLGVTMRQAESHRKYKNDYGLVGVREKDSRRVLWSLRA